MPRIRLIVLSLLGITLLFSIAHHQEGAAAQQAVQPVLLMSGVQLAATTRYSVTIANPTQTTLGDLRISVQLPADAGFDHALETAGFTRFTGNDNNTLTWTAATFAPNDAIDAFTFFLTAPVSGSFTVSIAWGGDAAGNLQRQFQITPQMATDTEADVTIDTAGLAQGLLPVGDTGILIAGTSGQIPEGTALHLHLPGATANPPAETGDLWWCTEVEVDGLPDGAGLHLLVPARQPLPPGVDIALFQQVAGQWTSLADGASVTLDGQYIIYTHHGGLVAAGTPASFQPLTPGTVTAALAARPPITPAVIIAATNNLSLVQLMQQPANCGTRNCNGMPPCGQGVFSPNLPITGPTRSCANAGGGTTTCANSGLSCGGTVPLLPNFPPLPAAPGHGTACTFPSITQVTPSRCGPF